MYGSPPLSLSLTSLSSRLSRSYHSSPFAKFLTFLRYLLPSARLSNRIGAHSSLSSADSDFYVGRYLNPPSTVCLLCSLSLFLFLNMHSLFFILFLSSLLCLFISILSILSLLSRFFDSRFFLSTYLFNFYYFFLF